VVCPPCLGFFFFFFFGTNLKNKRPGYLHAALKGIGVVVVVRDDDKVGLCFQVGL